LGRCRLGRAGQIAVFDPRALCLTQQARCLITLKVLCTLHRTLIRQVEARILTCQGLSLAIRHFQLVLRIVTVYISAVTLIRPGIMWSQTKATNNKRQSTCARGIIHPTEILQ
jgi:hypothetical protein